MDGEDCSKTLMRKLTPFLMVSPKAATMAKYWMTRLVFTVFPAPDSPLTGRHTHKRHLDKIIIRLETKETTFIF